MNLLKTIFYVPLRGWDLFWNIIEWFLRKAIALISYPLWIINIILRSSLLKTIIIGGSTIAFIIYQVAGTQGLLTAIQVVGQILMAISFMIIQFVALFWFLSSTKTVESHPGQKGEVTFKDNYFGNEYLVETVQQYVSLLVDRTQLRAMGGETLPGILLTGEPGTGKTLLAKCLASEAKAGFIGMSGSDFQAMFFGVGPMKVIQFGSKLKKFAKKDGAAIGFIDEIDAIGGARGGGRGDPRRGPMRGGFGGGFFGGGAMGVLSRLLTVMDGLQEVNKRDEIQNWFLVKLGYEKIDPGVVLFMAATNRPDILDPALIRPGRFDTPITVDKPDKVSRKAIFEGYLKKVEHDPKLDVDALVELTSDVTPAHIETAIRKNAVRMAIFAGRDHITQRDIENAIDERKFGLQNPISDFDPEQKEQVAYHESGHAILMFLEKAERLIRRVSIIRRSGGILGYVDEIATKDVYAQELDMYVRFIYVLLAGHIASVIKFGKLWTGASSDFMGIQTLVRILASHGYFETFPFALPDPLDDKETQKRATEFMARSSRKVKTILEENWSAVEALAEELLIKEDLTGAEVISIIEDNLS